MATPPATTLIAIQSQPDLTRRHKYYEYAIQFADPGTPTYPAGGVVVDLTAATNPKGFYRAKWSSPAIPANSAIAQLVLPNGYVVTLQQGATLPTMKNFVVRIWTAPGTELGTNSNIPSGLFGATIGAAPLLVFRLRTGNWY